MSNISKGIDALNELNSSTTEGGNNEFSKFSSGSTYLVKVLGKADLISFYSYGIYKQINSFVSENPSKKSKNGNPVENLGPFDKAWKYYADKSEQFGDEASTEAYKYKPKQRFAMGFYDINAGEPIVIDVSKKQAQVLHGAITKNEKRLDTFAFELTKQGSGTGTTVSLDPYLDDMSKEQEKHFHDAPKEFDTSKFDGILYEMSEDEQIEKLAEAGFDVSLIGLEVPEKDDGNEEPEYDF